MPSPRHTCKTSLMLTAVPVPKINSVIQLFSFTISKKIKAPSCDLGQPFERVVFPRYHLPSPPQAMPPCCGAPAPPASSNPSPAASSRTWRARGCARAWRAFPSTSRWGSAPAAAGGFTPWSSARPSGSSRSSTAPSPCSASAPSLWTGWHGNPLVMRIKKQTLHFWAK